MGTRHNTIVINDGKEVFNTYGQWDGYPTTAGVVIRDFLKRHKSPEIKDMLKNVVVDAESPDDFQMSQSFYGYKHPLYNIEEFTDRYRYSRGDEIHSLRETIIAAVEEFGFSKTMLYYMLSRNTGYQLLDVLEALNTMNRCYIKRKPIHSFKTDCDTGISYTVNLDDETFTIDLHGNERTWKFDKLPSDSVLERFEKSTFKREVTKHG